LANVLIISLSDLKNDPRVYRQIDLLKDYYEVSALGLTNPDIDNVKFYKIEINNSLFSRLFSFIYKFTGSFEKFEKFWIKNKIKIANNDLFDVKFDFILANEIDSLPVAFKLINGNYVLIDLHEYAPLEFEDKFLWNLLHKKFVNHQCNKYLMKANRISTVCDGIADEYFKNYGVKPEVITNAKNYCNLKPVINSSGKIKMLHHGAAISSRKIELMIETMNYLDDKYELDLMLVPTQIKYYNKIKSLIYDKRNIRLIDSVPMNKIIVTINKYDIGLFLLPPVNFNYRLALPNKLFEFIQARLAIAIGPSPEMASIVRKFDLGMISDSFKPEDFAREIKKLTYEKILFYKNNCDKCAFELSYENIKMNTLKIFQSLD
jgi:hypothetical protein